MLKEKACRKKLKLGDTAPLFSLPDKNGKTVSLEEYIGHKNVVLYFYPKDNTRGCIVESSSFRDLYEDFQSAQAEVIGVSSDGEASHRSFASEYKLPFVLLSDEKNEVRKLYGVPATFGIIPGRMTFVIDKQGIIRHLFSSQFNPKSHVEQALQILKTLPK